MMSSTTRWFEPSSGSGEYRRAHYVLFWILLAAAAFLRFWRLGDVGLSGDEDLMGLAARGVLDHGIPVMPSGMIYPRAPVHTYLLAASVQLFGDTEWALRLPSAIAGLLCGWLAFLMGRRFLDPAPNLAFVAAILFLPDLVWDSQYARMYIFFNACLLLFGLWLFRWERTQRARSLAAAFVAWLLALQFQPLAIFASPLFLYPGLVRGSRRLMVQGAAMVVLAGVAFLVQDRIANSYYPQESQRLVIAPAMPATGAHRLLLENPAPRVALGLVAAIAILATVVPAFVRRRSALPAAALLGVGVAACALAQFHAGGLALLAGSLLWARSGDRKLSTLALVAAAVIAIAAIQVYALHDLPARKIAGALIGKPGLLPVLRFAQISPAGAVVYVLILGLALWRLARGQAVPEHFLFFALAVWGQILAVGFFRRDVPIRYTYGALPFFLVCLMAGITYVLRTTRWGARLPAGRTAAAAGWFVVAAAVIHPIATLRVARNDRTMVADHKGAADFIRGLRPGPGDLLIAEDSINQTYYLGHVDYRLLDVRVAAQHSVLVNGVLRGQYTGTPILGTGAEFERVLDQPRTGEVYVIGSGEDFHDGRRHMRGNGIQEVLDSGRFEVVYEGRDRRTRVWRLAR